MVLHEIMNVPDNIPANLVDKAECVIVFPSVLKGGFIVGGAYGRGAMVCRSGEHFNGPWGTPLDDGFGRRQRRFPNWRRSDGLRHSGDE